MSIAISRPKNFQVLGLLAWVQRKGRVRLDSQALFPATQEIDFDVHQSAPRDASEVSRPTR